MIFHTVRMHYSHVVLNVWDFLLSLPRATAWTMAVSNTVGVAAVARDLISAIMVLAF